MNVPKRLDLAPYLTDLEINQLFGEYRKGHVDDGEGANCPSFRAWLASRLVETVRGAVSATSSPTSVGLDET